MDIFKGFTAHPDSVGETYSEHLLRASYFGARMILAGAACILHGLLPFLFVRTGSRAISELNEQMIAKRSTGSPARALRVDLLKH
jgi:Family of unknown function (DUF6356)